MRHKHGKHLDVEMTTKFNLVTLAPASEDEISEWLLEQYSVSVRQLAEGFSGNTEVYIIGSTYNWRKYGDGFYFG